MTNINEILKDVGKRLTDLRKSKNLTQVQLSNSFLEQYNINIHARSISRYETGKGLPDTDNLIYLADFFGVTTDYILYGKELSDDYSFTRYDNFKRLNRLLYARRIKPLRNFENRSYVVLQLYGDEMKVYWERLQSFAVNKIYEYEKEDDSAFYVKDMDALFADFQDYKEQLALTPERFNKYLKSQGIDPEKYRKHRIEEIKSKRKKQR